MFDCGFWGEEVVYMYCSCYWYCCWFCGYWGRCCCFCMGELYVGGFGCEGVDYVVFIFVDVGVVVCG